MKSLRRRLPIAAALAVAAPSLLLAATGAAAPSGSITNLHRTGEQLVATFSASYDVCEGAYCGWFPVAYQYPAGRPCGPEGDNPVWVGELHSGSGSESGTESFYPVSAGSIRICLYAVQGENEHLLAQTVYEAPPASKAHLSFDRACYRENERGVLSGRGFKRGTYYTVSFSRGRPNQTASTNSQGRLHFRFRAPDISTASPPAPLQRRVGVSASEYAPLVPGGPSARATFLVTTLAVSLSPELPLFGDIPRRVSFRLTGFDPGRPIFAHWRHRGHSAGTERLGRAHGPCGELRTARKPFRERIDSSGSWTIQFDQRRAFSFLTNPRAHISFSVVTTFGRTLMR